MIHDPIRCCENIDELASATTAASTSKDPEMRFATPESRAAFLRPVLRAPQNKRLRVGPLLPFIDDFTAEDARRSIACYEQRRNDHVASKKAKRKHSASF